MNNQVLKKNKIDVQYVLSEKKFLYTFGCICFGEKFILNRSWTKKDIFYFFEHDLEQVPEEMVTYENVAKGDVILVGRPNSFRAFLRPQVKTLEEIETVPKIRIKRIKREVKKEKTVEDYSLTELLDDYHNNMDSDLGQIYFEELIGRLHELKCDDVQNRKNYVKVYKRKQDSLDKND